MNKECDIFDTQAKCYNLMHCECMFKGKLKLPLFPNEYIKSQYEFMMNMYKAYIEALNDEELKSYRADIYHMNINYYWRSYQSALREYKNLII